MGAETGSEAGHHEAHDEAAALADEGDDDSVNASTLMLGDEASQDGRGDDIQGEASDGEVIEEDESQGEESGVGEDSQVGGQLAHEGEDEGSKDEGGDESQGEEGDDVDDDEESGEGSDQELLEKSNPHYDDPAVNRLFTQPPGGMELVTDPKAITSGCVSLMAYWRDRDQAMFMNLIF